MDSQSLKPLPAETQFTRHNGVEVIEVIEVAWTLHSFTNVYDTNKSLRFMVYLIYLFHINSL